MGVLGSGSVRESAYDMPWCARSSHVPTHITSLHMMRQKRITLDTVHMLPPPQYTHLIQLYLSCTDLPRSTSLYLTLPLPPSTSTSLYLYLLLPLPLPLPQTLQRISLSSRATHRTARDRLGCTNASHPKKVEKVEVRKIEK